MKLTIQISTQDLQRLTEDVGYGSLVFNVERSYQSSDRLRGMKVVGNGAYYDDPKKRKAEEAKIEKQQKLLEASEVSDFLIKTTRTNSVKYKVLKIEPDDERHW